MGGRTLITDKEKLDKVLEFVTQMENKFYDPITEGKIRLDSEVYIQYMLQAISFQKVRYFIENLMEFTGSDDVN